MRPVQTNSNLLMGARDRSSEVEEKSNAESLATEGDLGTPAAREAVAKLYQELLPGERISRSQFLDLTAGDRVIKHVDLKTMIGLILGAWALQQSNSILATNHKSSAAFDYSHARSLMVDFEDTVGPEDGESDIMRAAKLVSFAQAGVCGRHADRNFVLIGSMLHRLFDEQPGLRDYLPHVERMVDSTAGARLGGAPTDDHAYVRIGNSIIVDSWVLFPMVHLESEGKYEPDETHEGKAFYDVAVDKHQIPNDVEEKLNAVSRKSNRPQPELSEQDYRGREHWVTLVGTPIRTWQVVQSRRDDAPAAVYVCGDLQFDPDLMDASGLALRKTWHEKAAAALDVGQRSPIRGLSPLRRPEPEKLPSSHTASVPGGANPEPSAV
ncbi:hypothetical protein GCM10023165_05370 [Variovorax defluvii]|uniref:Uncharacterized protein n=1 Tax=Variovorax defluvii TaxID=913761 RepID=A0ABP8GXI6_9BURK